MTATDIPSEDPPATPALDAWYEAHRGQTRDRASVELWWPTEAPSVYVDTIERGCHLPAVLPDPERPTCHVRLGGSAVSVGGYLSDMEAYFAAVVEAIKVARWQADTITARMAAESEDTVR